MASVQEAGVGKNFGESILTGVLVLGGMLLAKSFFPAASIIVPAIPASIATTARGFLIIFASPVTEEPFFRKVFYEWLRLRSLSDRQANFVQAIFFGIFHTLVYGLALGQLDSVIVAFGMLPSIAGGIIAAAVFGYGMRIVVNRTARNGGKPNLLPAIIAHAGLNAAIFLTLAVVF